MNRNDMEIPDESLAERDGEMLEHIRLHFDPGPGMPRSWEEMSEVGREYIRRLYWETMEGETSAG